MSNPAQTHTLRDLSIDFVSLVPQGADPDARIMLAKAHTEPDQTTNPGAPARALPTTKEAPVAELNETVAKALGEDHGFKLTDEQIAGLNALATEPTAADPDPKPEVASETLDGTATVDASITKAVEPIQKLLDETRDELAKERETRGITEAVDKARIDYANLSVDHEAIGGALYRMSNGGATSEDVELMTSTLKAASAQNAVAAVTAPIGFDGDAPEGSPAATIDGIAKGLQEADPKVTELAARVAAARTPQGIAAYDAAAAE